MRTLVENVKAAQRAGTPLVSISTPDPAATIDSIVKACNGKNPIVQWDIISGFAHRNEEGLKQLNAHVGDDDASIGDPPGALQTASNFSDDTIVFIHQANRWLDDAGFVQAVWNLRDPFKATGRMLVLLGPHVRMPSEIKGDVIALEEPLPDKKQLFDIASDQIDGYNGFLAEHDMEPLPSDQGELSSIVEAVQGLHAFQAEQVIAMSFTPERVDKDSLWESKRQQVEATQGVSFFRNAGNFSQLGGMSQLKQYFSMLMKGRGEPDAVVWLDEIEKSGVAALEDTSGTNRDQLGLLLQYLEDHKVFVIVLVGFPGCGKSEFCKCVGGEFEKPVLRLDMGEMKGSHVGESEAYLRNALKVVTAVGNDNAVWIVTANDIAALDGALKSRFTDVFFFDIPEKDEKDPIWDICKSKFEIADPDIPDDEGWAGRNIFRCCQKAWNFDCSLKEAAKYIIPVSVTSSRDISSLRDGANGKYLSSNDQGVYRVKKTSGRKRSM